VPDGTGMLFLWKEPSVHSLWMYETRVPLDAAFLDAEDRIVSVARMEPGSLDLHRSPIPVTKILETPSGYLNRLGVGPGDRAWIVLGPLGDVEP